MTPHWHARAQAPGDPRARDLVALLSRCAAGDRHAREMIIVRFLPLARRLARRYEGRGEPLDDLVQAASVGLIRAVDLYSPDRGAAFPAYARPMILGEIRRHFRDTTWPLHVPRPVRERAGDVLSADRALGPKPGSASRGAIATYLRLAPEHVAEAERALESYRPDSLDATYLAHDGETIALGETVGSPEPGYEQAEMSVGVRRALLALKPRDRTIIWLRLACELSQDEIARRIGLSQMQVSRILRHAGAVLTSSCGLAVSA
jgi:RNA polymerase sigma-B factor